MKMAPESFLIRFYLDFTGHCASLTDNVESANSSGDKEGS